MRRRAARPASATNCGRVRLTICKQNAASSADQREAKRWQNARQGLLSCSAGAPRSTTYPGRPQRTCFVPSTPRYDVTLIGIARDGRWIVADAGNGAGIGAVALVIPDDGPQ